MNFTELFIRNGNLRRPYSPTVNLDVDVLQQPFLPEINLNIETQLIKASSRRLKAKWTLDRYEPAELDGSAYERLVDLFMRSVSIVTSIDADDNQSVTTNKVNWAKEGF